MHPHRKALQAFEAGNCVWGTEDDQCRWTAVSKGAKVGAGARSCTGLWAMVRSLDTILSKKRTSVNTFDSICT